jgi:nucleolar pre-ribosomal-associated protein 2
VAKLLAIHRIVKKLEGSTSSHSKLAAATSKDEIDLGTLHTVLCKRLRQSETAVEFVLISQILETIMDEHWNTMTQWNVELTLSTVSTLASHATTHKVISTTPKAYECLCRLVQTIVRRHRLRLEGHFHLLITVLQSLLRSLICHPYDNTGNVWTTGLIKDPALFPRWEKHAKAFARLLTRVCEPTPGSVARSQQGSLDSATDAAKRYAGQHMYLVLMTYIKLQLEQNVPHDVREALEPGVFAILDITTPEGRRIMNDALDGSGRAIMKELYKQYVKFGKWSGI